MKSFQIIALLLWGFIFIIASFILGQFLASKDIFDVTEMIIGNNDNQNDTDTQRDDTLANEIVIDKVGQETVRIGLNIAKEYFANYYKQYVNYIMLNSDTYPINHKISINNTLASDYVFYAISNDIDDDKYESDEENNYIDISEAEINSFVDNLFGKEIDETFKKDGKYGYDKANKKYSIEESNNHKEYVQELQKIENITSNELVLTYSCKKMNGKNSSIDEQNTIELTVMYKGGRYIVTEVQKVN